MKVIEIKKFGGPEVLELAERHRPEPSADEVLIEVHAAGINRPDCAQRAGTYPPPLGASDILGLEVAGEVIACGKNVTRWKKGDFVCALITGEVMLNTSQLPQVRCLPIPYDLDMVQAAALPETFLQCGPTFLKVDVCKRAKNF